VSLRPCQECKKEISSDAKACPNCGKQQTTGSNHGCLIIIIVLVVVGVIGRMASHDSSDSAKSTPPSGTVSTSSTDAVKQDALSKIKLDFTLTKDEMGIITANFVVKNESSYNIKDFEITCEHFANSGSNIDSNVRTIYDIVMAHTTRKVRNFNMGFVHSQASKSSCKITDLKVIQ
jgi:uncharacterized protein (UPF0333 family)